MSEEQQQEETFAQFEAGVLGKGTPEPVAEEAPAEEPLELTEEDEVVAPEGEDESEEGKGRHKSAKQRIGELTAKLRQTERELAAERAERGRAAEPKAEDAPAELKAPDPNDAKYEFGEADPRYIADLTRYEVKQELENDRKAKDADVQKAEAAKVGAELDTKWQEAQAKGAEKYEDFTDKLESLKISEPILAIAVQASPVAADAAYHLANHPHEAALLEARIKAGDILGAAERFGEIEGATLEEAPVYPTNGNPLDIALYAGRLKTYQAKEAKPKGKIATEAPEPAKHSIRGGAGKFEVSDDTNDFASFERKYARR